MTEPQKTAAPGSDPGTPTPQDAGAAPAAGQSPAPPAAGDKGDKVPWDQDPRWKVWRAQEQQVNQLMKENDVETIEDLLELVDAGKLIKSRKVSKEDFDAILEKAQTLERYEEHWKAQEEINRRKGELPEDTITRLEREMKELKRSKDDERSQADIQKQNLQLAQDFDRDVKTIISGVEGLGPKVQKAYAEFFGVENPASSVDIRDKKAVRKMVQDGLKRLDEIVDLLIEDRLQRKGQPPPRVPSSGGGASPPAPGGIKNLREARAAFRETVEKMGNRGG